MKEELIRILNSKLDDTNVNIESLMEINSKIEDEKGKLEYATNLLEIFKGENGYNSLNLVKIEKDEFEHAISILPEEVSALFQSDSCNYDGLVYLINGINNGVSLTLTDEQKNAIVTFINEIDKKCDEYTSTIEGLSLIKERFAVSNLDVLNNDKARFEKCIENINNNYYVTDTDAIKEAIEFNRLENSEVIELLGYVLKYNADVYKLKGSRVEEFNDKIGIEQSTDLDNKEVHSEEEITFDVPNVRVNEERTISFEPESVSAPSTESSDYSNIDFEMPISTPIVEDTSNDLEVHEESTLSVPLEEEKKEDVVLPSSFEAFEQNIHANPTVEEYPTSVEEPIDSTAATVSEPVVDNIDVSINTPINDMVSNDIVANTNVGFNVENQADNSVVETPVEEVVAPSVNENVDVENENVETTQENNQVDETTSTRELQRLFVEYNIKTDKINLNELLAGNINNYKEVLDVLKENKLVDDFEKNTTLFTELLLGSGKEEIENVLKIIKEDLSVDNSDYRITLGIAINTIPTIFIKDGGNYDNFVRNVQIFKDLNVNLISLFDFSKEVFIASSDRLINNYNIVKNYNVKIDYNNVKYLLLLPNIGERLDYYVESTYPDKTKNNDMFDGINFINNYAVKLNTVSDLTIKRLRFASENEHKVFGSKEYSLSGEITNLKVNALDISDAYLNSFFNNEFDGLTADEVREYVKLVHNTSNVGNYTDELSELNKYHQGLRYIVNGINISYNKVVRNYNILRSYGISTSKALHFAICYNLVITKSEYINLKSVLGLGGNA